MFQEFTYSFMSHDYIFIDCLIFWFPLIVVTLSILSALIFRRVLVPSIIITMIFTLFFIYTSTQGVPFGNYYPCIIGYFLISLFISYLTRELFRLVFKRKLNHPK